MFSKTAFITLILAIIFMAPAYAQEISPQEPNDAIGYFCNMTVANHSAAKAQLFLKKKSSQPLWFSTIRDMFIYLNSPEEDQRIAAIYVNDMGVANWDEPEAGTWISAYAAYYVIKSNKRNGMGGMAIVPFSNKSKAQEFVKAHGGEIKSFNDVPKSYILSAMQHHD